MASARGTHLGPCRLRFLPRVFKHRRLVVLVVTVLLASLAFGQATPRVTAVEPSSGKVNDNVTVTGENLGKSTVAAAFLSDDKTDYEATLVEQAEGKIVIKVPQVKAGDYHVSLQVGNNIYIQPVRFTVQK
jgi:IPT/TIG domain